MRVYAFGLEEHTYAAKGRHTSDLYYYALGGRLLGSWTPVPTPSLLDRYIGQRAGHFQQTDHSAAIAGNQVFGPYGNLRDVQGNFNTPKGFTGQYNDSLTGLDYYGSRYYDQVAGVFLSADVKQGNVQGMDPYALCGWQSRDEERSDGAVFCTWRKREWGSATILYHAA